MDPEGKQRLAYILYSLWSRSSTKPVFLLYTFPVPQQRTAPNEPYKKWKLRQTFQPHAGNTFNSSAVSDADQKDDVSPQACDNPQKLCDQFNAISKNNKECIKGYYLHRVCTNLLQLMRSSPASHPMFTLHPPFIDLGAALVVRLKNAGRHYKAR